MSCLWRTYLRVHGKATGKGLHRATVELVCAPQQARFAEKLLPLLTEEEASVFRRGRNANVHSIPHHADRADYQKATGLEALFGWLYLRDDHARINESFYNRMSGGTTMPLDATLAVGGTYVLLTTRRTTYHAPTSGRTGRPYVRNRNGYGRRRPAPARSGRNP